MGEARIEERMRAWGRGRREHLVTGRERRKDREGYVIIRQNLGWRQKRIKNLVSTGVGKEEEREWAMGFVPRKS